MSSSTGYITIGVDGGGSGCRAAVANGEGRLLGQAAGGPANVTTNAEVSASNVAAAIQDAMNAAKLDASYLRTAIAHVGLAGVLTQAQAELVTERLQIGQCTVTDDRPTSLAGALGEDDGALVAVGTGTFIAARRAGEIRGVGGWGFQVSDQASGAWLGRALLEHVLLCHDAMADHSDLTHRTLADFGGPGAIVEFARDAKPDGYAALAPSIVSAFSAGDPAGAMLMRRGANYLDRALEVLGLAGSDVLCLGGGVGPHYASLLRPEFADRIQVAKGTALDGALRLARQALEAQVPT